MPELISRAELSRILGSSKANVTKLCANKFSHALHGKEVDISDPIVNEHIELRKSKLAAKDSPTPAPPPKAKAKTVTPSEFEKMVANMNKQLEGTTQPRNKHTPSQDVTFEEIEGLTVRQVVERYGGIAGFKLYVDSLRGVADWKNKELKFNEKRSQLIEIDPLAESLFAIVNLAFKRIVGEYPTSITPQIKAIAQAGGHECNVEMIKIQEKQLSKILKDCKSEITKSLKSIKRG